MRWGTSVGDGARPGSAPKPRSGPSMIALPAHPAAAEVAHHEEHDQDDHDNDDDIFDTHGCHLRLEYYAARRG
jgi:hypothetical protein